MAQQRYSILEKLDAGGMAEVWKGTATSLRGFEKLVAIKRVLPHLARNQKFITMFLDEARLSLFLNHANVVQTFDIGMSGDSYFIVMEFVDGSNLKAILEVLELEKKRVPPHLAAFIGIEICKGLNHAHLRRDSSDRPLNIVHRDISPPNVLLSREGEVKLADFGLAKAVTQVALTDPGVVKGKFSYLSPEAAFGDQVDYRADIFATGIILWELLAGRRLFSGGTDLETIRMVRKAEIPPLKEFNDKVDHALEVIVRKALAAKAENRYASTVNLGEDLARYLFSHKLMVTSFDVARLVSNVTDIKKREARNAEREQNSMTSEMVRMVREEIGKFTSLEDLERMPFKSVLETEGQTPERGLAEEDPRAWLSELGLDDSEVMDPDITDSNTIDFDIDRSHASIGTPLGDSASDSSVSPTQATLPARAHSPAGGAPVQTQSLGAGGGSQPLADIQPAQKSPATAPPPPEAPPPEAPPPARSGTLPAIIKGIALGLIGVGVLGVLAWVFTK